MSAHLEALIQQHWPDHVPCLEQRPPINDPARGVVCDACGTVLGFVEEEPPDLPEPDAPEVIQRVIARLDEQGIPSGPEVICPWRACVETAVPRFYGFCSPEHAVLRGREVLRHDPPDHPDRGWAADAVRNQGVRPNKRRPIEDVPLPQYGVGDTVTVAGMTFTKHSELPDPFGQEPSPVPPEPSSSTAEGSPEVCGAEFSNGTICDKPGDPELYGYCSVGHARWEASTTTANPDAPESVLSAAYAMLNALPESEGDTDEPEQSDVDSISAGQQPPDKPVSDEAQADWMDNPEYQAAALAGYTEGGGMAYAVGFAAGERAGSEETTGWEQLPGVPSRPEDVVPPADPLDSRVVVIDSSQPYTPADVEAQLVDVEAKLERGIHYQRYWEERGYKAAMAYELAWARAVVRHRDAGAADVRKALATIDCEMELAEKMLCDTMVKAMRETMHNLRSLQTGYQTISNSVRSSYSNQR